MATDRIRIFDVTRRGEHEKYLYRCLAPMPFRKYNNRQQYLMKAIPKGFHKKLLVFGEEIVGQIEYAPAEVSGYPITGDNIIVMNCIWVLSRVKGRGLGRLLVQDMVKSEKLAAGFATVALENHWSPWFRRSKTQKLGFRPRILNQGYPQDKTQRASLQHIPHVDAENRECRATCMG
jgi:ribosomal protein S18 acetylase RimI-like enzyme